MLNKILIVDDEEAARYGIRRALEDKETQIFEAGGAEDARAFVKKYHPDVMLTDINMPEEDGIHLMKSLADDPLRHVVVMITAYGSAKVAVDAMKAGAYDYVTKPFEIEELRLVVRRALQKIAVERENRELRRQVVLEGQFGRMIGKSEGMQRLFELAAQLAETDVTVLIEGESGTGKELLAHEIHDRSSRKKGPFVASIMPPCQIRSSRASCLGMREDHSLAPASNEKEGSNKLMAERSSWTKLAT